MHMLHAIENLDIIRYNTTNTTYKYYDKILNSALQSNYYKVQKKSEVQI